MTETSFSSRRHLTNEKAAELCPAVEQIARKLLRRLPKSVGLDDLIGAGNLGLVHALAKFDPDDCAWFDGYALQRARGAMLDELRRIDPLGRFERRKVNHLKHIERDLTQQLGRKPGSDEVREAAGLSDESFHRAMEHARRSFVEPLDTTGADTDFGLDSDDPWSFEDRAIAQGEAQRAHDRLAVLPGRLRLVLQLYYLEDRTLKEIGEHLGVTEPRVHQLRNEALNHLRATFPAYAGALAPRARKARSKRRGTPERPQSEPALRVSVLPPPHERAPRPEADTSERQAA